jgi:hypothetical protein
VLLQGHRQEVIGAMQEVVQDMLKEFHRRNNGRKPQALIYYRDGVADSQFPTVLEHEYTAFRRVSGGGVHSGRGGQAASACGIVGG